jgi:hypothetical protein
MKINTSRTKAMKETCRAYNETTRNLNFRASVAVTPLEATQIMCAALECEPNVGGYNAFQPDALIHLPNDAQVTLAREGSVCIYFTSRMPVNPIRLAEPMKADEFDVESVTTKTFRDPRKPADVLTEYRVWWD